MITWIRASVSGFVRAGLLVALCWFVPVGGLLLPAVDAVSGSAWSWSNLWSWIGVALIVVVLALVAARWQADQTRRLMSRWAGIAIEGGYRGPGPEPVQLSTGFWWNGYSYERSRRDAVHDARWRRWVSDPAYRRDLRWILVGAVTVGPICALPFALLALAGVALTYLGLLATLVGVALILGAAALSPYVWRLALSFAGRYLELSDRARAAERIRNLERQRADLTATQAAEIQRIERDLHDGAQARLIAVGLSLAAAERLMDQDPDRAKALLREARRGTSGSLAELRELVHGISPPVLVERGPIDAIRALALDSGLDIRVEADASIPFELARGAAVYFAVAELLANVGRHAPGASVRIDIRRRERDVEIVVSDNGPGGARQVAGGGLEGIQRRLAAFDGMVTDRQSTGRPNPDVDSSGMRVVVAEDLYLLREGIVRLVEAYGHEVVAATSTGPETLTALLTHRPDVSIIDVRMPPTNSDEGLTAALAARKQIPGLPVLILSQHVEQLYARELLADNTGGIGYLLKDSVFADDQFIDALERVAAGGSALDPVVVAKLLTHSGKASRLSTLTPRERSVLTLMAQGLSNTAIAQRLLLSESAVSKYTTTTFDKLGITDDSSANRRVQAVLTYLNNTTRHHPD